MIDIKIYHYWKFKINEASWVRLRNPQERSLAPLSLILFYLFKIIKVKLKIKIQSISSLKKEKQGKLNILNFNQIIFNNINYKIYIFFFINLKIYLYWKFKFKVVSCTRFAKPTERSFAPLSSILLPL